MSVSQRKSRKGWLVKFKDAAGKWRQKQFKSREEAEEFDAQVKLDVERNEPLTLAEAVMTYLTNQQLAPATLEHYQYVIAGQDTKKGIHHTGPAEHLATRYVETLTRADLESVRQNILAGKASVQTANLYCGKLKAALNWCESEDLISVNPWKKYRRLPVRETGSHSGTLEDLQAVYAELPSWMKWAVDTALALCLRPGEAELFSLQWSAFNWTKKTATIYMPKVRSTKTVAMRKEYFMEARERYNKDSAAGKVLVVRNRQDRKVTYGCYHKAWTLACQRAGVSMTFYAVRHIAASAMIANGADIVAVASMLGHKNANTTGKYYAHAMADSQQRACQALPTLSPNLVAIGGSSDKQSK